MATSASGASPDLHAIRNVVLVGTGGAGKTTLVEHMLHEAGVIGRIGRIEDGNTVCDHDELEHEFQRSHAAAVVHFNHAGAQVDLVDTPGQPDFVGSATGCLPAADLVLLAVDATVGIEPVIRRYMRLTRERNLPRAVVINKIDNASDLGGLLEHLREAFGGELQPVNLPANGGAAVVDCFKATEGESDLGPVADFHTGIVDQVVEVDEDLMAKYLEQGSVTPEELHAPFERALREAHLVPVLFTSAREGTGVKELMDFIAELAPNPAEGNPRPFVHGSGDAKQDYRPEPDASKPLVAHVFKVASDPYVGKLSVFRVHQGALKAGDQVFVSGHRKPVRVAHIFKLQGKDHVEVPVLRAGDVGAVSKIDEIEYDSVLHDGAVAEDLRFVPVPLSKPMFGLAIEGTSKGADAKLGEALRKMAAEDPTFEIERVAATGELVLRGLGEQHLRIKIRMLKDRYGIDVDSHPPKVAYKETISAPAEGHHRHKKQSGGAGQFGEVFLRVKPMNDGEAAEHGDLEFVDDTFGGSIPKQFLPAIEKGVRQVMQHGAIAGYPMQKIRVEVYDGKHHPVDSKEVAFMTAGRRAFIDAVKKAKPVLLEPFVRLEITVPGDLIGDISSDLSGHRGRIQGTEMLPGGQAMVVAEAPLSEVMSYASRLKSITGGAGSYAMEYSHDEPTPANVQEQVVAQFNPQEDED